MLYTYICKTCTYEEDEFRSVADREILPDIHCPICDSKDWKYRKIYLPQRVYSLKIQNETFPMRSNIRGADGKMMNFESKKSYDQHLSDNGLCIFEEGSDIRDTPAPSLSNHYKDHPLIRKWEDQNQEKQETTSYITEEEINERTIIND